MSEMTDGVVNEFEKSPRTRREVLGIIGGLGAAIFVAGCASDDGSSAATKTTAAKAGSSTSTTAPADHLDDDGRDHRDARRLHQDPRGDGGAVPG